MAVETAGLYEDTRRHGEQLELSADISRAIASSIDLDQTLRLVAQNLARLVDASMCQIALYEEDREGWFGAAASDQEDLWRRQHGERSEPSFLFNVLDHGEPLVIEDTSASNLVSPTYARTFGVRSLLALPLVADGQSIGAAVLAERDRQREFTPDEVQRAQGLALQAAVAIKNARLHALAEEERHLQKDFVLIGFGQWGQKAYQHLLTLKQFFNFRTHVVEQDSPGARERIGAKEEEVRTHGDSFYWDSHGSPARDQLERELECSSYVITYVATPAATHLPTVALYYDLSDVILIEKPLGAPPEAYRELLDAAPGGVEIVAADHYYFKLEVRLLQLLLTEERTLRDFLDSVDEIRIEILEEQPLTGAAADIGVIADLIPHAFAIISLLTPIDHIHLDAESPLLVGRHEGLQGQRESYARMNGTFPSHGRSVRLVIDVGKGAENAKWIKLSGERRAGGRSPSFAAPGAHVLTNLLAAKRAVLKNNRWFAVSAPNGEMTAASPDGHGLWHGDTRVVSEFHLLVDGREPEAVDLKGSPGSLQFEVATGDLRITRERYVDEGLHERITITNGSSSPVHTTIAFDFGVDQAAMLAVRGIVRMSPASPGQAVEIRVYPGGPRRDQAVRVLEGARVLEGDGQPIDLGPGESLSFLVDAPVEGSAKHPDFDAGLGRVRDSYRSWAADCATFETDNTLLNELLGQSRDDMRMLLDTYPTGIYPTGGMPWFAVPFGRDALFTSSFTLPMNPDVARGALRFLAQHQGERADPRTEEEPG